MKFLAIVLGGFLGAATLRGDHSAPRVKVTLAYETLCPFCKSWISEELLPLWARAGRSLEVELIPYGNARLTKSGVECQHGTRECLLNAASACGLAHVRAAEQPAFVKCIEGLSGSPATCVPAGELTAWTACMESGELTQRMRARSEELAFKYVPYVLVDGRHSADAEQNLAHAFCQALLEKGGAPKMCQQVSLVHRNALTVRDRCWRDTQ